MAANVFGELLNRRITPQGLFAQRHQYDVVKIAAQPPPQLDRRSFRAGVRGDIDF